LDKVINNYGTIAARFQKLKDDILRSVDEVESKVSKNIYEEYARKVLQAKNKEEDTLSIAEAAKALGESFGRTYHAVALDIEGTIRVEGEDNIPKIFWTQ